MKLSTESRTVFMRAFISALHLVIFIASAESFIALGLSLRSATSLAVPDLLLVMRPIAFYCSSRVERFFSLALTLKTWLTSSTKLSRFSLWSTAMLPCTSTIYGYS